MYTVVRQRDIEASTGRIWSCLTEPARLGHWFADVERLAPGEPFCFSFGDGDSFLGEVVEWQPESSLGLTWRFMGIGPRFEIRFCLEPLSADRMRVSVIDRGALTREEAAGLGEGWIDFLARLAMYASTDRHARYEWSETIGLGALLQRPAIFPPEILDREWWRATFPGGETRLHTNGAAELRVEFADPEWGGELTEAQVTALPVDDGLYLGATHQGWTRLPAERRIAERRRYAEKWLRAFTGLEAKYA